jgi:hypothetical protein
MPIPVRGVLVQAMPGTELSRVRTEFRLRLPEPINKSPFESPQNENVRFVQSRNVRFHGWPRALWKRSESR